MNSQMKTHRARAGRAVSTGVSVLVESGYITLPVCMCSSTWKLPPNPGLLGFNTGFLS